MAPMRDPRTPFAGAKLDMHSRREKVVGWSYDPRRHERLVMGLVGVILLLVLALIVALGEDLGAGLAGCCGALRLLVGAV